MNKKHYGSGYKLDREGMVYGMLTVVKRLPGKNRWLCECECGNKEFKIQGQRLSSREKTNCGCEKQIPRRDREQPDINPILENYLLHYKPEENQCTIQPS